MASAGDAEVGPDLQRPPAIEDFDEKQKLRDFAKAFNKECLELLGVEVNLVTTDWKARPIVALSLETGEPKPGYKTFFTPSQEWLPRLGLKAPKAMRQYKLIPLMVASVQRQADEALRKRKAAGPAPIRAVAAPSAITPAPQQQATSHQAAASSSKAAPSAGPLSPFSMYTAPSYAAGPKVQDAGQSLSMQTPQQPVSRISQPSSQAQPSNGLQGRSATAVSVQASAGIEELQAAVMARMSEYRQQKQRNEQLKAKIDEMKSSKAGMNKENTNANKNCSAPAVVVVDDMCQSLEGAKAHVRGLLSLVGAKDDDSLHASQVIIQALKMYAAGNKKFRDDMLSTLEAA